MSSQVTAWPLAVSDRGVVAELRDLAVLVDPDAARGRAARARPRQILPRDASAPGRRPEGQGRPTTGTASTNSASKPISAASAASSRSRAGPSPSAAGGQVQVAVHPFEVRSRCRARARPARRSGAMAARPGVPDRLRVADAEARHQLAAAGCRSPSSGARSCVRCRSGRSVRGRARSPTGRPRSAAPPSSARSPRRPPRRHRPWCRHRAPRTAASWPTWSSTAWCRGW